MSTNGKHFLTLQITVLAVFAAIIIFTFQLMDTKVERSIEMTVKLMERVSALEARATYDEQRLDRLLEHKIKNSKKGDEDHEKLN